MGERPRAWVRVALALAHVDFELLEAARYPHVPGVVAELPLDPADDRGYRVGDDDRDHKQTGQTEADIDGQLITCLDCTGGCQAGRTGRDGRFVAVYTDNSWRVA